MVFPGRKLAKESLRHGHVLINGKRVRTGVKLVAGDHVSITTAIPRTDFFPIANPKLTIEVLAETEAWVALNKPSGMSSHPLREAEDDTVANFLAARWPDTLTAGEPPREAGLIHRLDGGTSGVIVAARTSTAFRALRKSLLAAKWQKRYLAVVEGVVEAELGAVRVIEKSINVAGKRVRVLEGQFNGVHLPNVRDARSEITLVAINDRHSLLRVSAPRATRHQVRAHLASIGHPIVGDTQYGAVAPEKTAGERARFLLHAAEAVFPDPIRKSAANEVEAQEVSITVTAPAPDGFRENFAL